MAIRFESVQPGMTLYDNHRHKLGNTTMSAMGEWVVKVYEVDAEKRQALVSWNSNPKTWWPEYRLRKLFLTSLKERKAKRATRRAKGES